MKNRFFLIVVIAFGLSFFAGCTIHFKAKDVELDSKPPEGRIGALETTNHTYALSDIDIL